MKTQRKTNYEIHCEEQFDAAMASLKRFCDETKRLMPWRDRLKLWWWERMADIAYWLFR